MGRSRTMIARFVTGASARLPRSAEACVWGLLVLIPCGASESPAPRVAINRPAVGLVLPLSLQAKQAADVILVGNHLDRARRITCECTDLKTTIRSGGPLSIQARVEASNSAIPGPRALVVETPKGPSNRILFRVTGGPASSRKNRTKAVSKHSRSRRQRSSRARSRPYKTRTCFGSTWTLATDLPSRSFQRAAGPAAMWPQS